MKRALLVLLAGLSALGAPLPALADCFQPPAGCTVSSAFGFRQNPITHEYSQFHGGVDFACPVGTAVQAGAAGSVARSRFQQHEGNLVVIQEGPYTLLYMHNSQLEAAAGDSVSAGQEVAKSGNTGDWTTGPHVHFQVHDSRVASHNGNPWGEWVNPTPLLCSSPSSGGGVLDGATISFNAAATSGYGSDAGGSRTTATAPSQYSPPMDAQVSLAAQLDDAISARAENADYRTQLSTLSEERLYAEVAHLQALRLRIRYIETLRRERILAMKAMVNILYTDSSLRPVVEAERSAAVQAGARAR